MGDVDMTSTESHQVIEKAINRIACIGAGVIGHSWATFFSMKGYTVYLHDINEEVIQRGLRWIKTALDLCAEKRLIDERDAEAAINRVKPTINMSEAVSDADYIVESVLENYDVKKKVFREIDAMAPEEAIIASSSSFLLMTEIQKVTKRPERCIEVHPYNPPHLIPLVEIVPGQATSMTTVARTFQFMKSLGKVPIVPKKEVAGYIANRLQRALNREAHDLVNSGVASVEDVDKALSAGPGIRWAIYGPFLVSYFNTPSHLMREGTLSGMVKEGYREYSLLKGKTFDDMVRWRDSMLVDTLRVLQYLPECSAEESLS
ncbi:MAG: 3-hydroxyacyl-CoA dehydrogenase family protein [Candidatus Bathyarchaeota archaeon]|nr:3-hydroxyacyl-CoA dehydrogenase family protein [Candidatus Bathyarchaeota archaeon]